MIVCCCLQIKVGKVLYVSTINTGCNTNIALAYMNAVLSKAMIGTACDLIMDAYIMEMPAMKTSYITTLDDTISKQKWSVDAKTVKKLLEFEKDKQSIDHDDLQWLPLSDCDIIWEDMTLPLPLHNALDAFPTDALKDLLVLRPLPNVPVQPEGSLEDLMSVFIKMARYTNNGLITRL